MNRYTLTIEDVAARLGVCDQTVRNRLRRCENSSEVCRKIGRRLRFSPDVFASTIGLSG